MARLLDDIRAQKRLQCPWYVLPSKEQEWIDLAQKLMPMLDHPSLPVILADNVADYYYRDTGQEDWNIPVHFPNLAPPFEQCWIEHRMPNQITSDRCGNVDLRDLIQHGRVGVLVTSVDPSTAIGIGINPATRWILWMEMFLDYGTIRTGVDGPHGSIFLQIDEHGVLLETPWMQSFADESQNKHMGAIMGWTYPILLTITFLHCKNVTVVENQMDKPLAKKFHNRTGKWPTKFKTLVIEPLKNILRTQGRSGEHGLAQAMHICRGHFRDYREGKGLFGKYKVLVWTPMIVRGSKKGKDTPREIVVKL
jgi:hypothetical protein